MNKHISRRMWLKKSFFCFLASKLTNKKITYSKKISKNESTSEKFNIFWGDIHNHNSVGYAKGSLKRTFEIAKSHLDFFAFTPHSQWHDMPQMQGDKHLKWVNGFEETKNRWNEVQKICADYNKTGEFITFPAYEWHSSYYGDYFIIFPYDYAPLIIFNDIKSLQKFARKEGALLIPHHPGYRTGHRGANFDFLDSEVSPVLEIYSEHGNAERDDAPYQYIRHSMGGCLTKNTMQYALVSGHRIGVIANTDDHLGYPGAYGEGLAAVIAEDLSRESILNAVRKRRTYGVTGDRINLNFKLNGHFMGEEIPFSTERDMYIRVSGWDKIERVEVIKNNQLIYRDFPMDRKLSRYSWNKQMLLRIEFGWGPWADLNMSRICDWEIKVEISNGEINDIQPCFQSGPLSESRRNLIKEQTKNTCLIKSYTSRQQAFAEKPTNAVVLNISGTPETKLSLTINKPTKMVINKLLKEFEEKNDIFFTGPFPDESLLIHPLVFSEHFKTEFNIIDKQLSGSIDWYYIRVIQANGQLAWSSPIWVEKT